MVSPTQLCWRYHSLPLRQLYNHSGSASILAQNIKLYTLCHVLIAAATCIYTCSHYSLKMVVSVSDKMSFQTNSQCLEAVRFVATSFQIQIALKFERYPLSEACQISW